MKSLKSLEVRTFDYSNTAKLTCAFDCLFCLKLKKFNRYQSSFLTEKYEFIGIISISDQDHDDLMVSLISKNSNAFDFFKTKRSFILLKATRDRLKLLQIIT